MTKPQFLFSVFNSLLEFISLSLCFFNVYNGFYVINFDLALVAFFVGRTQFVQFLLIFPKRVNQSIHCFLNGNLFLLVLLDIINNGLLFLKQRFKFQLTLLVSLKALPAFLKHIGLGF